MEKMTQAHKDRWLQAIFSAKTVERGGVVRRSVAWVEREIGSEMLIAEVRRRGFHMLETGGQYLIVCNRGQVRMIC
ncbi:N-(5'-phosphoribosyl)anthranilate isomerase [Palleronia sediminis]|uniref:N-(5'-phosphoribosyl)anthranilate isomerase n=1 Tax=Palleronia sediminis TaxID=2547833 RepID=A0A4R6AHP3_9RHOB|nr:N-(5'-phosphoribosyl)anthranilate isomerase [Palleronia sediminis]TDL83731.1 N-(5'-phosphoribosyl)anthranilate isomerase [Palleronia sediminis]